MATRLLGVLGLALALLLCGCTAPREEPGLFRVRSPAPSLGRSEPSAPPPDAAPELPLPVAGERVWTTAEGIGVGVRFAVHAVRRIEGATVLDWSVTPWGGPGLAPGDTLPALTDLGVSRQAGADLGLWLLDPAARQVYRTLSHTSRREFHHCLCTPVWAVQPTLRIGETRLLQAAFPVLPERTGFVDVHLANTAPVVHVPVTPVGQVPTARTGVDLARPAEPVPPAAAEQTFGHGRTQPDRRSGITVDQVVAAPGHTALTWTLHARSDQRRYRRQPLGPPVDGPRPDDVELVDGRPTDGPTLRPAGGGAELATSWITASGPFDRPALECLCSSLGLWSRALDEEGGAVQVVGLYPALPAGTRQVEVTLPGVATVSVPVVPADDTAARLGPPVTVPVRGWVWSSDVPPQGWPVTTWPTPVPDPWQLPDYRASVAEVTTLPRA